MMTVPLIVLAFFAAIAGVLNLPFTENMEFLNRWLEPVIGQYQAHLEESTLQLIVELTISTIVAFTGIGARLPRVREAQGSRPSKIELPFLYHGWYIDHGVTLFMGGPGRKLFELVALFDRVVIDGAVNGVGRAHPRRRRPPAHRPERLRALVRAHDRSGRGPHDRLRPHPGDLLMTAAILASEGGSLGLPDPARPRPRPDVRGAADRARCRGAGPSSPGRSPSCPAS